MSIIDQRVEIDGWKNGELHQHIQDLAARLVTRGQESTSITAAQQTLIEGIVELRDDLLTSYDDYVRAGIAGHIGHLMANHFQSLPTLRAGEGTHMRLGELETVRRTDQQYQTLCKIENFTAFAGSICFRARASKKAAIGRFHGMVAVVTPNTHPTKVTLLDTYESRRLTAK
jgi:hypothetical protein